MPHGWSQLHLVGNHPPTSTYHNGRKKRAESCSIGYIVRSWRLNPPINIFNHEPENWVWLKHVVACPNVPTTSMSVLCAKQLESVSHLCCDSPRFQQLFWLGCSNTNQTHTNTHTIYICMYTHTSHIYIIYIYLESR